MKPRSIKTRITLWITLLVVALFSLMLLFAFSMSSSVVQRTARQQLADAVRANAAMVSFADGQFAAGEGSIRTGSTGNRGEELRALAGAFGYSGEDVARLESEGYTPEEIEDWLYGACLP